MKLDGPKRWNALSLIMKGKMDQTKESTFSILIY